MILLSYLHICVSLSNADNRSDHIMSNCLLINRSSKHTNMNAHDTYCKLTNKD